MKWGVALAVSAASIVLSTSAFAGTVTVEQQSGRNVRVFVPSTVASPTPLVVMLHGCTQTADAFADATQMDAIAEKEGFVVAYPEQSADTISTRCFQWYEPAHQARDAGEPKELADAADAIAKGHGVDPQRVYVAGLSAGAAMSVILGATYPDRFVAIGVVAGVEYKGATSVSEGFSTASNGGPDPDAQGDLAHTAMGARARVVPTFVVHGTADGVLAKVNGDQVAEQWRRTNTLVLGDGAIEPVMSGTGTAGYTFTHMVHRNKANGASVVEYYVVDNLGHAWPGGKDGGSYSDKSGPDASALLWAFFKGRTLSAPLDVAPASLPGTPAGSTSGGTSGTTAPGTDPSNPSAGAPPSSTASGANGASSGGCSVAFPSTSSTRFGTTFGIGFGAALVLAMLTLRRRMASVLLAGAGITLLADGCGSDTPATNGGSAEAGSANDDGGGIDGNATATDAGVDSATARDGGGDSGGSDGACPTPKVLPSTGETCVGFGTGTPCDTSCGLPKYGYVCFNGGPPGFTGCVQASSTGSFGDTYCCPDDKCVPQPDQDAQCTTPGKTHRYQCPPDGAGGNVAPPSGCVDGGAGGSAVERFYCCP